MHAQNDAATHAAHATARRDFDTYGNLSGRERPRVAGTGRMGGTALEAFRADVHAGNVDYVFYSYGTPIAWHVSGYGWKLDGTRHSAPSDAALSAVRRAISEMSDALEPTVTVYRYRHGLSDRQWWMLEAATKPGGVGLGDMAPNTLASLLKRGYIVNGRFDSYVATPLGRRIVTGAPILCRVGTWGDLSIHHSMYAL